jgi:origin recognition complex subunit 3
MARPRESLKRAFGHPADYLNCTCCKKESDQSAIRSGQPATSILHELYVESATGLINLYDFFGMFSQVRQGKEGDDSQLTEEQLLASFMASLDELVWMGYVKKSRRKTDHVEKLVGE